MLNPLLLPELREMLAEGDDAGLRDVTTELHAATIAEFSEGLTNEETWRVLDHATIERQAEIFAYFPIAKQVEMVEGIGKERMSRLLEEMPPDNRVDLLKRLEPELVESLLPLVAKAERHDIRLLLSCPEHSAGAIMTTEYASLPEDITVADALSRLRTQAPHSETIYYIYVLDVDRHLLGTVSLHQLILARPNTLVRDLMQRDVISVRVDEDQEDVAKKMARYDFIAMPVVDTENHLVGIVTHDDVIDVVVEEATEDALRMGGVGNIVEHYLDAPFIRVWWKRSVWLSCLFIAELFTFTALAHYGEAIEAIVALALFVPLCISTGGNSGSQAATLITRAMALGHIKQSDWWRVLKHELLMGLALGLTLGAIGFVRAGLTPQSLLDPGHKSQTSADDGADSAKPVARTHAAPTPWQLALVISQAVMVICLWGTLVGAMLPLLFKRIGIDAGYASSPFVATFVDVTGILIYFSIAGMYLTF